MDDELTKALEVRFDLQLARKGDALVVRLEPEEEIAHPSGVDHVPRTNLAVQGDEKSLLQGAAHQEQVGIPLPLRVDS